MTWGASEWGAVASAAAAIATAAAGYMALIAANRTIKATKQAATENAALLREQIEVQRLEISELKAQAKEAERQQKLFAAYTFFKLTGDVHHAVSYAVNNYNGSGVIIPRFKPELVSRVEASYQLQSYLSRDNHVLFQLMDAVVHGEAISDKEHGINIINELNRFRNALTPAIVGLPKGDGVRVYGHDGMNPLVATPDVDI